MHSPYFDEECRQGVELAKRGLPRDRTHLTALELLAGLCFGTTLRGRWPELERCLDVPQGNADESSRVVTVDERLQREVRRLWTAHDRRPLSPETLALGLLRIAQHELVPSVLPQATVDAILAGLERGPQGDPTQVDLEGVVRQLAQFARVRDSVPEALASLAAHVHALVDARRCPALVLTEAYDAHRAARQFGTASAEDATPPVGRIQVVLARKLDVEDLADALMADPALATSAASLRVADGLPVEPPRFEPRGLTRERPWFSSRVLSVRLPAGDDDHDEAGPFSLEIQLFTLGEHAWYRTFEAITPSCGQPFTTAAQEQLRDLLLALKHADELSDLARHTHRLTPARSDRMTEEAWDRVSRRAEVVLRAEPENTIALAELLQAAVVRGKAHLDRVVPIIDANRSRIAEHADLLRDAGFYLSKFCEGSRVNDGERLLLLATELDPEDPEALCNLGGHLRRERRIDDALKAYRRALNCDTGSSYALTNVLLLEIGRTGDLTIVDAYRSRIPLPEERCLEQFKLGVNAPWAMFDLGLLALMRGLVFDGLARYARGVADASDWQLSSADSALAGLARRDVNMPGLREVRQLLLVGSMARNRKRKLLPSPAGFPQRVVVLSHDHDILERSTVKCYQALAGVLPALEGTIVTIGVAASGDALGARARDPIAGPGIPLHAYDPEDGEERTVLDALRFWEDFLGAGGDPARVRWLVWGGQVAALEARIALAFGAEVGVVRVGDDYASELCKDVNWESFRLSTPPRLHALEHPETEVQDFLDPIWL